MLRAVAWVVGSRSDGASAPGGAPATPLQGPAITGARPAGGLGAGPLGRLVPCAGVQTEPLADAATGGIATAVEPRKHPVRTPGFAIAFAGHRWLASHRVAASGGGGG